MLTASDDPRSVPTPDWARVSLADGTAGYISRRWLRSPIDFRLVLRVDDGTERWWLGFLLVGH
ncbi:hypothetical protein [Thermomonas carbonis]|uniref:Uncharacterized protein n=1 Tax=Thermomonas carbonis TaxID=1463158 RepID=A0A7G9SRM2_9GAMM|nr:hypothetical protein [Thermomonas carbonis]QNN70497.1 hypothetical protein H9L16_02390 [Thermomonas carbonis]